MSSGTSVIAFDIGGNRDIINHKENGYLIKPFDESDFSKGIEWVLEDNDRITRLGKNAREKVLQQFDSKIVAAKYIELYSHILEKTGKNSE